MQVLLSPAKTMDLKSDTSTYLSTNCRFTDESLTLVNHLKKLSPNDIGQLMKISKSLAELNYSRFREWKYPFDPKQTKQALFAFKGDVYSGIDATLLSEKDIRIAQDSIRILSGLYGLLRPMDMILPYRLEMGTKIHVEKAKNLYAFWGDKITKELIKDINKNHHKVIINLASKEYFKAIDASLIKLPIISPAFKDFKGGKYKNISVYAKRARGLMTRYIIQNNIQNPEDLKAFDIEGYYYNNQLSTELSPVFTRDY